MHPSPTQRGNISRDQELLGLDSSTCSVTKAGRGGEGGYGGCSRGVTDKPSLISPILASGI